MGAPKKPGLVGRSWEGGSQRVQGLSLLLFWGPSKTWSSVRGYMLRLWPPWGMKLVWGGEAVGQPPLLLLVPCPRQQWAAPLPPPGALPPPMGTKGCLVPGGGAAIP